MATHKNHIGSITVWASQSRVEVQRYWYKFQEKIGSIQ